MHGCIQTAQRIVSVLLETETTAAEQFAQRSGWTFNPARQYGGLKPDGLPPEVLRQLAGMEQWEFTDRRPNSPTEGFTFYAPVGSSYEEIEQLRQKKLQQINAG